MPLELTLTNEEKIKVTASPVTTTGKPAAVDGVVDFTVSVGDCSIERIDALSVFIVSGGPGDSTVVVSADADLGSGVQTISDALTIHVTGALAAALGLMADAPIAK